jgi:hypothetical protein
MERANNGRELSRNRLMRLSLGVLVTDSMVV